MTDGPTAAKWCSAVSCRATSSIGSTGSSRGLDGWVYAANGDSGGKVRAAGSEQKSSRRSRPAVSSGYRRDRDSIGADAVRSASRRLGELVGDNNPTWLWHVTVPEHYLRRNPKLAVKRVLHVLSNYENPTRVHPASPPMVRPNQPWSLNHVTSACSPIAVPRFPVRAGVRGPSVFICEPVHNAVHREVLEREGSGFRATARLAKAIASSGQRGQLVPTDHGKDQAPGRSVVRGGHVPVRDRTSGVDFARDAGPPRSARRHRQGPHLWVVPTQATRRKVPDLTVLHRGRVGPGDG